MLVGLERHSSCHMCSPQLVCPFPLYPNLLCLGTIILKVFLEPIMLQSLMRSDALLWVVDEYLFQQVEEFTVELGVWKNSLLERG